MLQHIVANLIEQSAGQDAMNEVPGILSAHGAQVGAGPCESIDFIRFDPGRAIIETKALLVAAGISTAFSPGGVVNASPGQPGR